MQPDALLLPPKADYFPHTAHPEVLITLLFFISEQYIVHFKHL